MMQHRILAPAGTALIVSACSIETLQRTGFETLQGIQEQQCQRGVDADCPARERYDDYQRKRDAAVSPR